MTTFTDRENAIEAHFAVLELARFRDRLRRYKQLGLIAARHLGLHGPNAEIYAVRMAERCIAEPDDERLCRRLAIEVGALGINLSPAEISRIVAAGPEPDQPIAVPEEPKRSWVGYVMAQLMMLFGVSPTTQEAADTAASQHIH